MSISVNVYGPADRYPDVARGEYQWLHLVGDGTEALCTGGGVLGKVEVGVAGTLAKFYDTAAGGTADTTTLIATVDTSVTGHRWEGPIRFSKGLTVITTGASGDLNISFLGRPTVSARTFPS